MPSELYTFGGKRKYLTSKEQGLFLLAASDLERGDIRTLCMTLLYTGARISEVLAITPDSIDLSAKAITIRTLKQRNKERYREIPVPDDLLNALELVHGIRKLKKSRSGGKIAPLGSLKEQWQDDMSPALWTQLRFLGFMRVQRDSDMPLEF